MVSDEPRVRLGEEVLYVDHYSPNLLAPIPRLASREKLLLQPDKSLPFVGSDIWTAYELSWLNLKGKPQVAIAEFEFAHDSECIVESKSFKYYLNSFNQSKFGSVDEVIKRLIEDLTQSSGGPVSVILKNLDQQDSLVAIDGECVDDVDIDIEEFKPDKSLLKSSHDRRVESRVLYSHLLKSNCPVTGQPDWATIWIVYSGQEISQEGFLRYVISFRQHQDFHENCVEKMFLDITQVCAPEHLCVGARYTRRGGLDINPIRGTENSLSLKKGKAISRQRLSRQ